MTKRSTLPFPMAIGIDTGDRSSHFCVLDESTRKVAQRGSCRTVAADLSRALAPFKGARVVLEAGSQSPWLSRFLTSEGFRVHVADPRRVQLISKDPRKTDRRDAETLARLEAGMPEVLGDIRHRGEQAQADLSIIRARDLLVRMRTMAVLQVRSLTKVFGLRLPGASAAAFPKRVTKLIPEPLQLAVNPILEQITALTACIRDYERILEEVVETRYPEVSLLRQVGGVGLIGSTAYVLTIEDPKRFEDSRQVGSYLGLCPKSHASGDSAPELRVSKAGDSYLRRMLVQCAHYILGPFGKDCDLRRFGQRLAARGGAAAKKRAAVAVARKLAVLLHRLWRHGLSYDPLHAANKQSVTTVS